MAIIKTEKQPIRTAFGGADSEYAKQLNSLADWFEERLVSLPTVEMTSRDYTYKGVDALTKLYTTLVKEAYLLWLDKESYRLSYNQICVAFFHAAAWLGKLDVEENNENNLEV